MTIKTIDIKNPPYKICLGRQGENLVTRITFDCTAFVQAHGSGTARLLHEQAETGTLYPVVTTQKNALVSWDVTASDTAKVGIGRTELRWYVGETLAKTVIFVTNVEPSLVDPDAPPPQDTWVDEVLDKLNKVPQQINDALDKAKESGEFDGITPDIQMGEVEALPAGAKPTATITGPKEKPILTLGIPAGSVPNITIGKVETLAPGQLVTVTITGTASDPVINFGIPQGKQGEQGAKGDTGADGKTPVRGVDYWTESDKQEVIAEATAGTSAEVNRPKHTTMVVTAMTEGIGFKADYTANEIRRHRDGGGLVLLNFEAPDGTGEQSYRLETIKNGKAVFRRPVVDPAGNTVSRIVITIDDNYNVEKTEESISVATKDDIQQLEDSKANYTYKVIAKDVVTQADAREVLTYTDQYDGKLIEFLTNGDNPSKCVATGRVMTESTGDTYLITYNRDGTTTVWSRDEYEKHQIESTSLINAGLIDIDNLTIDNAGDAPHMYSVRGAMNDPSESDGDGVVFVLPHAINKQIQYYIDMTTGREWYRLITGTADSHSFGGWVERGGSSITVDSDLSDTSTNPVQNKAVKAALDDKQNKEGVYELIEEFTAEADAPMEKTAEPDGTPYNFKAIAMTFHFPPRESSINTNSVRAVINGRTFQFGYMSSTSTGNVYGHAEAFISRGYWESVYFRSDGSQYAYTNPYVNGYEYKFKVPAGPVSKISTTGDIPAGTIVQIWAVRA